MLPKQKNYCGGLSPHFMIRQLVLDIVWSHNILTYFLLQLLREKNRKLLAKKKLTIHYLLDQNSQSRKKREYVRKVQVTVFQIEELS